MILLDLQANSWTKVKEKAEAGKQIVKSWLDFNKLSFNVKKTVIQLFP